VVYVDEQGIRFDGPISTFGWTWPACTGSAESEKIFLVFVSRFAFAILPKRIFGAGAADEFPEILGQKLLRK
jgi:YcxB-like protein